MSTKETINLNLGRAKEVHVKPLLRRLFENAEKNNEKKSKHGYRHEKIVKDFAAALYCLIGRSGYELLQTNLGGALPTINTIERMISKKKLREGKFYFEELKSHLDEWNAPPFVHINLDDTRVINRVEYDQTTICFIGWCLPVNDGIPDCDAFQFGEFKDIKHAFNIESLAKYAHCIVAKSVNAIVPSFIIFVLGTDSKYDHIVISKRFEYVSSELGKLGVKVVSNGADGAGPFLKAMVIQAQLFKRSLFGNVLTSWSFFVMPKFMPFDLSFQDHVHLLAKFRTRLWNPSNLLILGNENASKIHLHHVLNKFEKGRHNLTFKDIDSKDKQNYNSVTSLLSEEVESCIDEISPLVKTRGTIAYLKVMRFYRDSIFDKSLSPLDRINLIRFSLFFVRIWRTWLNDYNYNEEDHYLTPNIHSCLELNAHMLVCLVHSCMEGTVPTDSLRIRLSGSQGCESVFRLLRSMTGTFSTIINFTMRGIMNRINKLNFLAATECSEEILFPRLKRRLLQLKEESEQTFILPNDIMEMYSSIIAAKHNAIEPTKNLGMELESYDDDYLIRGTEFVIEAASQAISNMTDELDDVGDISEISDEFRTNDEIAMYQEETLSAIKEKERLRKQGSIGMPTYNIITT